MRAARFRGIRDVRVEDVALPVPGPGEVLVKVAYAGICGSDLHVYAQGMFGIVPPMTMGHEFSGVVEEVGEGVEELRPGDHVVGDPRLGCERCEWCARGEYHLCADLAFVGEALPGSYAEFVVLAERRLVLIAPSVDLRVAALVEPLAVAVHAMDLAMPHQSQSVGIIGAGPIGLLALIVARQQPGAFVRVADKVAGRRDLAASLGADEVIDDVGAAGDRWAHVVVEAAGKQAALAAAVRWLRPGGVLALVGIYEEPVLFDPTDVVVKEARLVGVSAYGRGDLVRAAAMLERDSASALKVVSDVLPLERVREGLELCRSAASHGKVLLDCRRPVTGSGQS